MRVRTFTWTEAAVVTGVGLLLKTFTSLTWDQISLVFVGSVLVAEYLFFPLIEAIQGGD